MFLFCLVFAMSLCASVYMCFVVTFWERADLSALVCGVCCEFVTFPLVSWVRCGTWLYRFLIFALLLTFFKVKPKTQWPAKLKLLSVDWCPSFSVTGSARAQLLGFLSSDCLLFKNRFLCLFVSWFNFIIFLSWYIALVKKSRRELSFLVL